MSSLSNGFDPQSAPHLELHFTRTNGAVDDMIDALLDHVGGVVHRDLVREMMLAALKAGQESQSRADLKLMNSTLKEMRFTAKVFAPYREVRKVTVFGSARTAPQEPVYGMARELGGRLADAGYMVITGGGSGIMEAANEGAGPQRSFGVKIRLPFEARPNPVLEHNPRLILYKYFFNRKVAFLKEADAVVLFPGGFGTLDEAMEALTLVQTGKQPPIPLLLIEPPGEAYWSRALEFFQHELLSRGYIDAPDLDLLVRVTSTEEALRRIDHFYSRYHSMRFVGERLVIRLTNPLPPERVAEIAEAFADVLRPEGKMVLSPALPQEKSQPQLAHLPRLVVDFNRRDYGRLHGLIEAINA